MRYGVNARRLSGQHLGIGRYIEYLARYWAEMLEPDEEMTFYVQEPLAEEDRWLGERFRVAVLESRFRGLLWENTALPRRAVEQDVLFCPSYTAPIRYRGRSVVATHSINEIQGETHPWWYYLTYTPWYRHSARTADRVIVPSRSTQADLTRYYGVPADRIDIVPEGVDASFAPVEDPDILRKTREKYVGSDVPYVLFVGKPSQRRNIPLLIRAFADVKKRRGIPHKLLLLGPNNEHHPYEQLARELGIEDDLVNTNPRFPDHRDIMPVYSAADLYAFPSRYEGFSLTTLEAMACGLPVVAGNGGALREIAEGAALTLKEFELEELSSALERVLTDRTLWSDLRARSLERVKQFPWEDTARGTLDVLRRVARG